MNILQIPPKRQKTPPLYIQKSGSIPFILHVTSLPLIKPYCHVPLNHFVHVSAFPIRKNSDSAVLSAGRRWSCIMLLSHTTALSREKFGLDGNIYIRKPAPTQIYRGYRVWNFARISINGFVLHGWSRRHWTLLAGNYKVRRRGKLIQSTMACHRAETHQDHHSKALGLTSQTILYRLTYNNFQKQEKSRQ